MTNITDFKLAATQRRQETLEVPLREIGNPFGQRDELQLEYSADPADVVRSQADREIVISRLDDQTRRVHEIEDALDKLSNGSYGACEHCEEQIAPRRLDAVPWARLCVRCQSRAEAGSALDVAA
jgi:DnaK suppressor protein